MSRFWFFVLGAGLGYCGGHFRKEIAAFTKFLIDKIKDAEKAEEVNTESESAKEEFRNVADKFSGIYESLYLVAIGKVADGTDVVADWNARVRYLNNAPHFQSVWNEKKEHLADIITFFEACGIERDARQELTADEKTRYQYVVLPEEPIQVGQVYEIMSACWTLGDKIIEKGTLKK